MRYLGIFLIVLLLGGVAKPAGATPEWVDYAPEAFADAQQAGRTILVDVHATWCPTCKVQAPILDELLLEPSLSDVTFVKVDFDLEEAFIETYRIPRQSTILVFRGETEIARSVAETDRDRLRSFVFEATRPDAP
jgi:thiol-disulfide isomerase/thioredoxin